MNYKYQRRQIFGKRLKVPKDILNKVYNCRTNLTNLPRFRIDFSDNFKYNKGKKEGR